MRSPYFGIGIHKFPKVPRQYFVTPVFDNQKLYDPLQCYHRPIMQPQLSVAVIICTGVSLNTNSVKYCNHPVISCLFQVETQNFSQKKSVTPSFSMTSLFERKQ